VVQDDFWFESMMKQDQGLVRWEDILKQMLKATGYGTRSDRRIRATLGFIDFIREEVEGLSERWVKRKAEIDAQLDAEYGE
jgi:hypothetical protein